MSHSQGKEDPLQSVKDVVGDSAIAIALAGAVVSIATSYVPFSPLLGGLLVGWLVRDDKMRGAKLGGLSGLVLALPGTFIIVPFFGFALLDASVGGFFFLLLAMFFVGIVLVYTVGISAVGGYIGVSLYQDRVQNATPAGTRRSGSRHSHGHDADDHEADGEDAGWGNDDGWGSDDGGVGGDRGSGGGE